MNWTLALPEIALSVCAMAILMYGVMQKRDPTFVCTMAALGALVLTGALVLGAGAGVGYRGLFVVDGFAVFMKVLVLVGAGLTAVLALGYDDTKGITRFEFPVLVLLSTVALTGGWLSFRRRDLQA